MQSYFGHQLRFGLMELFSLLKTRTHVLRQDAHVWLYDYLAVVARNTIDVDRLRREWPPAHSRISQMRMILNGLVILALRIDFSTTEERYPIRVNSRTVIADCPPMILIDLQRPACLL